MKYTVYTKNSKILRTGICANKDFLLQARNSEFVMEGIARNTTQKVEFDSLDDNGQPINPRVVDKTPEEIEADKPPVIPFEKQSARITNKQWQDIQDRLATLESA